MEPFPLDQKPIKSIFWANDQCSQSISKNGVELIEVQYVPGDGAMIPWFICWGKESKLIAAINSSQVECVVYI